MPGTCSIAPYVNLHIADIVRTRKSSYRDQRETSTRLSTKLESPLEEVSTPTRGATPVLDKSECPKVFRDPPSYETLNRLTSLKTQTLRDNNSQFKEKGIKCDVGNDGV